jgi:uncharacterized repeat protein (TIGR03987 family)
MLPYAIVAITSALVFYSLGVWAEKLQGKLKPWHLAVFWAGFACDTLGTTLMAKLAGDVLKINFHGITGLSAIVLMLAHAVWASVVIARNDERARTDFHRVSVFVWLVWLVPYLSGAVFGMAR